jgi:hypothetical protein
MTCICGKDHGNVKPVSVEEISKLLAEDMRKKIDDNVLEQLLKVAEQKQAERKE